MKDRTNRRMQFREAGASLHAWSRRWGREMKEIYPGWEISIQETSNGCYTATCTDRDKRIVEYSGPHPVALEERCLGDVKQIEIEKGKKRISDSLCDRRDLKSLSILIPGILSLNGLTDGWHAFYDSLIELKQMRRQELTENELSILLHLISLVAETTNPQPDGAGQRR